MTKLNERIDSYLQIWNAKTKEYINTLADKELNSSPALNDRAFNNLVDTYGKMVQMDAELTGLSTGINEDLKTWDSQIKSLDDDIVNNKQNLKNQVNINNSSGRFKTDKYNSNSEAYIQASFYILSLSTLTFFIYKQLKQ